MIKLRVFGAFTRTSQQIVIYIKLLILLDDPPVVGCWVRYILNCGFGYYKWYMGLVSLCVGLRWSACNIPHRLSMYHILHSKIKLNSKHRHWFKYAPSWVKLDLIISSVVDIHIHLVIVFPWLRISVTHQSCIVQQLPNSVDLVIHHTLVYTLKNISLCFMLQFKSRLRYCITNHSSLQIS